MNEPERINKLFKFVKKKNIKLKMNYPRSKTTPVPPLGYLKFIAP